MNSKSIKIIITIIFFLASIQLTFSKELILPPSKPDLSNELIKKKITNNFIIPQKKPIKEEKKITKKTTKIAATILFISKESMIFYYYGRITS